MKALIFVSFAFLTALSFGKTEEAVESAAELVTQKDFELIVNELEGGKCFKPVFRPVRNLMRKRRGMGPVLKQIDDTWSEPDYGLTVFVVADIMKKNDEGEIEKIADDAELWVAWGSNLHTYNRKLKKPKKVPVYSGARIKQKLEQKYGKGAFINPENAKIRFILEDEDLTYSYDLLYATFSLQDIVDKGNVNLGEEGDVAFEDVKNFGRDLRSGRRRYASRGSSTRNSPYVCRGTKMNISVRLVDPQELVPHRSETGTSKRTHVGQN